MAGIYIHVPFCQTRCLYCDFFSNTKMDRKREYLNALFREISERREFAPGETIETLYFGGGTPSQLSGQDLEEIFIQLQSHFDLSQCSEITLEANPEDLTPEYVSSLRKLPINRISMGIQSFSDQDLEFLNRRHNSTRALQAVRLCQEAGFDNISIDLMYGLPGQTLEDWEKNLDIALSLNIQHISSYHLIYEEGTAMYRLLQAGKIDPADEEVSVEMFRMLIRKLSAAGFSHYEISNFARENRFSAHNSSYWKGISYLGLGPGAHSFDGNAREHNLGELEKYNRFAGINASMMRETEHLSTDGRYNEFIMTGLRTMWGVPLEELRIRFGEEKYDYCLSMAAPHLTAGMLFIEDNSLKLTREGIFVSDGIMSDLMYIGAV